MSLEIISKEYADSTFASGPVVKTITSSDGSVSVFTDGPNVDLKVKGSGGELKSKGWLCIRNGLAESGCDFKFLETHIPSILESVDIKDSSANPYFNCQIAKIVFNEEKSMAEVSKWLFFDAIMVMDYASVYDDGNFLFYAPHAICPWPEDKPWK